MSESSAAQEIRPNSPLSGPVRRAAWRVALSILIPVAWISGTLLFVAFWAAHFTLFQGVIVVMVSLLLLLGTIAAMWVIFGVRLYHRWVGGWVGPVGRRSVSMRAAGRDRRRPEVAVTPRARQIPASGSRAPRSEPEEEAPPWLAPLRARGGSRRTPLGPDRTRGGPPRAGS